MKSKAIFVALLALAFAGCVANDENAMPWAAPDPRFARHPYWNGKIRDVTSRNRFFMAKAQWGDEGAELEKAEPPSVSDRYVRFYNAVLHKARAVDPLAEVCAYAYANYVMPPKEARVADGVVISFVPNVTFPYSRAGSDEYRSGWTVPHDANVSTVTAATNTFFMAS